METNNQIISCITLHCLQQLIAVKKEPSFEVMNEARLADKTKQLRWRGLRFKMLAGLGEISASGMPEERGIFLVKVPTDSQAAKMGFAEGDVVLELAGIPVSSLIDFIRVFDSLKKVGEIQAEIWSDQRSHMISIKAW